MSIDHKPTIGVIGYGVFGQLTAQYLSEFFELKIWNRSQDKLKDLPSNCSTSSLEETAAQPIVILAVTLNALPAILDQIRDHLQPNALVLDVTSVKIRPVELMEEKLPEDVEILGTHPLFGPQSAPDTVAGQTMILCPVRIASDRLSSTEEFLKRQGLNVRIMTPEEHDQRMAYVHALTFFVARGLMRMDVHANDIITPSFKKILDLAELEAHHSDELFKTIEQNPYAAEVRAELLDQLTALDKESKKSVS